nr:MULTISPECIES: HTH domain-containing protein [unclassified Pseudomonas]
MQVLRRHRRTVSGRTLAQELGVSLRTIRRDVLTLQGMGADIEGEPGLGYILKPGFLLPPTVIHRRRNTGTRSGSPVGQSSDRR